MDVNIKGQLHKRVAPLFCKRLLDDRQSNVTW